jgi:5-methyltetrahydrofolate--homocysteine methyltransferase
MTTVQKMHGTPRYANLGVLLECLRGGIPEQSDRQFRGGKEKNMVELKPIRMEEAARYLGYGGQMPDETILALMRECEGPLLAACHPAYSVGIFDMECCSEDEVKLMECALTLTGKDIVKHLVGCTKVVLMAATLGSGVDTLLRKLQKTEMPKALLTDAMAGAAIEQICDDVQAELERKMPLYRQTWRFSPGYGDLPLAMQDDLLSAVEAGKRIGLATTAGHMLTPMKSVTAIIGLQDMTKELRKVSTEDGDDMLSAPVGACAAGACAGCAYHDSCLSRQDTTTNETPVSNTEAEEIHE